MPVVVVVSIIVVIMVSVMLVTPFPVVILLLGRQTPVSAIRLMPLLPVLMVVPLSSTGAKERRTAAGRREAGTLPRPGRFVIISSYHQFRNIQLPFSPVPALPIDTCVLVGDRGKIFPGVRKIPHQRR